MGKCRTSDYSINSKHAVKFYVLTGECRIHAVGNVSNQLSLRSYKAGTVVKLRNMVDFLLACYNNGIFHVQETSIIMYRDTREIREALTPVFKKYNIKNAVLFGSYAKGLQSEKSDIDIAVNSGLKGLQFYGLLEDVCNAVDVPVDLIDTQEIVPDGQLDREIRNTGVSIYGEDANTV